MSDINVNLLQWFINFLINKTSGGTAKNEIMSNKKLAENLYKLIIRNLEKKNIQSYFLDNIWGADWGADIDFCKRLRPKLVWRRFYYIKSLKYCAKYMQQFA